MPLVERQVIKPNHRFYRAAHRLFLQCQKLNNCPNYICCQKFSPRQPTNALTVHRPLKKGVNNNQALPAKVTENTLRLLMTAWTSDRSVRKMAIAIAELIFDHHRKFMSKKIQKKREQGRYVMYLTVKLLAKILVSQNMPVCRRLIFCSHQKSAKY